MYAIETHDEFRFQIAYSHNMHLNHILIKVFSINILTLLNFVYYTRRRLAQRNRPPR